MVRGKASKWHPKSLLSIKRHEWDPVIAFYGKKFEKAFNEGDARAVEGFYAPDGSWMCSGEMSILREARKALKDGDEAHWAVKAAEDYGYLQRGVNGEITRNANGNPVFRRRLEGRQSISRMGTVLKGNIPDVAYKINKYHFLGVKWVRGKGPRIYLKLDWDATADKGRQNWSGSEFAEVRLANPLSEKNPGKWPLLITREIGRHGTNERTALEEAAVKRRTEK